MAKDEGNGRTTSVQIGIGSHGHSGTRAGKPKGTIRPGEILNTNII